MANITVKYKGLTGKQGTITIDNAQTLESLVSSIAADEGITQTDYYRISLNRNFAIENITYGDSSTTLAALSVVTGDEFLCTPNQNGTKEYRQIQKLEIAKAARTADGNARSTYTITDLPTKYTGNAVTDNANSGGLVLGRPWTTGAVTALFTSLGAEFEIRVDDTTGISPGMIMTGMDYGGATVTVVTVNSSTSLEMSIIAPDTVPAAGTVLTFTNP
jgi:hypothetical protein